jgi:hypothetical protein
MHTRLLPWVALVGLILAAPPLAHAAEKADKPTIIVRLKPIQDVIADLRYLIALSGRTEEGKQLDALIKSKIGPKGLEGIDIKKPIGMYGKLGEMGIDSQGVLLLPIADEKTFLDMLEGFDLKPEKGKGGLYSLEVGRLPFPILFRFANNYLYATLKTTDEAADILDKAKLPAPAAVLKGEGLASLAVHIDQIPAALKKMAIANIGLGLGNLKDQEPPGETESGKNLRHAVLDEIAVRLKSLLNDGQTLSLRLDLDRKTHDLSVAMNLTAQSGSDLAKLIAEAGSAKSVAASLIGSDSAMHALVHLALPASIRKVLGPAVDDMVKAALGKEKDEDRRAMLAELLKAVTPTVKAGRFDAAVDFRGPGKGERYTLVVGIGVKNGTAIEKALKKIVAKIPAAERKAIKVDFDKVGDSTIHRLTPPHADAHAREVFGDGPVYFAFRKDVVLAAVGENALDAIKGALEATPKGVNPLNLELSMARMAKLMAAREKAAPEAAKKAFKTKDSDKLRLRVTGGKMLQVRLSMKTQVVAFGILLDQARKEAAGKE